MIELLKVNQTSVVLSGSVSGAGEAFVCRVQYLHDLDPLRGGGAGARQPPRPLHHAFNKTIPLSYQLRAVHRLLHAPHRVSHSLSTHYSLLTTQYSLLS